MGTPNPAELPDREPPPLDAPDAIREAYRFHRAKRNVRRQRQLRKQVAGVRFYVVLVTLVFFAVVLALTVWNEIQRLFGL